MAGGVNCGVGGLEGVAQGERGVPAEGWRVDLATCSRRGLPRAVWLVQIPLPQRLRGKHKSTASLAAT